jgi:hypothetical protein
MLKIHQNIFDKKWLDDLAYQLIKEPWYSTNIANQKTWPYGDKGTHLLLGNIYFFRINENDIRYNVNLDLSHNLIKSFSAIENKVRRKMKLTQISTNLQFKEMDGTLHTDGNQNQSIFILMLSSENIVKNIGGQFYHQPTNTSVDFEHGKLIEQNGIDLHRAFAFNEPYVPRMSIKFVGENV